MNEVTNTLDKPILARYIRIHPVEWVGHISFRFELYGCYSGKLRRLMRREKLYISHLLIKAVQKSTKLKLTYSKLISKETRYVHLGPSLSYP